MITMDVKGITWIGCVYEKFESLCLEVEEDMYQDTVKFVEDQVQTVGDTVKKFYADVMQDLLSDPSLYQENISASGFRVKHYPGDDDYSKKSKIRKEKVKVDVEELNGVSKVSSVMDPDVHHTRSFLKEKVNESCPQSSEDCVKGVCSDLYSGDYHHHMRSYINENLVVKETPSMEQLPRVNTAVEKGVGRVSLSCSEISNDICDALCEQPDNIITPSAKAMSDDSMDAVGSNFGVHGTETIHQCGKAKIEETCVIVTGEELRFVQQMVDKRKPYKKKIPKAFTSRTISARKQEYEQLALWHGHHEESTLESEDDSKESPTHDFCESEWEIL